MKKVLAAYGAAFATTAAIIITIVVAVIATDAILPVLHSFSASADEKIKEVELPALKEGDYYLNGDRELGVYLHVSGGTISLKGEDLAERFESEVVRNAETFTEGYFTPEMIAEQVQEKLDEYTAENEYVVSLVGLPDVPYAVLIAWDKELEVTDGRYAGYGYWFNGTDILSFNGGGFGDFILME